MGERTEQVGAWDPRAGDLLSGVRSKAGMCQLVILKDALLLLVDRRQHVYRLTTRLIRPSRRVLPVSDPSPPQPFPVPRASLSGFGVSSRRKEPVAGLKRKGEQMAFVWLPRSLLLHTCLACSSFLASASLILPGPVTLFPFPFSVLFLPEDFLLPDSW